VRKKGRLLEVGCGWGEALDYASRLGWEASGVDISAECVAECLRRYPHLDVRQMPAEKLDFPGAAFDRVESFHVLEHVDDFPAALGEMARVLKPGGRLTVEVPAPQLERNLMAFDPAYRTKTGHQRVVTCEMLAEAACGLGLRLVKRMPVDGVLHLWVVRSFRRGKFIESDLGEIPGSSELALKFLRYFSPKIFRHRKLRLIPLWIICIPLGLIISRFTPLAYRYVFVKTRA
jgi:ubiquinone/menaquinone biosynthesis C-methylase UbiE